MPSGVPIVSRSASVSPASVTVRPDGAAVFQLRYVRGATCTPCSDSTRQIDSTRKPRARIWSMKPQISVARVELPREENRGRLQNLVGLLEISHFPLKILDALVLSSRGTRPLGGIHLGLQHPPAQRLRADPDLRADRLAGGIHRPVLIKVIEHHLHRTLTPLDWVVLGHDQHPSHRRKRHQTRNGSNSPAGRRVAWCDRGEAWRPAYVLVSGS